MIPTYRPKAGRIRILKLFGRPNKCLAGYRPAEGRPKKILKLFGRPEKCWAGLRPAEGRPKAGWKKIFVKIVVKSGCVGNARFGGKLCGE